MSQIRIVTDSGSDLSAAQTAEHNISIVPLRVRFGTEEFTDGVDITSHEFYHKMAHAEQLPATAAPSQGAFEQTFRELADGGATDIICINISYELSATGQAAVAAADAVRQEPGAPNIRTFDSTNVSCALGNIVLEAAKAGERGRSADEVAALVDDLISRTRLYGVLDTLENLVQGGRVGRAAAMLGSALSIKPILEIRGTVLEAQKARTRKKAFRWMREHLLAELVSAGGLSLLGSGHGMAHDYDDFCEVMLPEFDFGSGLKCLVGSTIGSHAGEGIIGMSYVLGEYKGS